MMVHVNSYRHKVRSVSQIVSKLLQYGNVYLKCLFLEHEFHQAATQCQTA